jgi:hypothetical protein
MSRRDLPKPAADPSSDVTARLDKELAAQAYKKVMSGAALTAKERAALKRFEKAKEEKLRWAYYATIPQKHWRRMSGRQTKVLNEQAALYGIPFCGPTIDLAAVARALHDFLAANAQKLAEEDDLLRGEGGSPALERYREERAALARLDRLERERQLLPRDDVRQGLARIAAMLRGMGEALQRQFGLAAVELLEETLDDAQHEIDHWFGNGEGAADAPASSDAAR